MERSVSSQTQSGQKRTYLLAQGGYLRAGKAIQYSVRLQRLS